MPTSLQLASGLGGAIGCDFRAAQNQLIFVEYSTGKLSALNLSPPSAIVAQSSSTILKGTWTFDFDAGVEGPPPANADVFWEQATSVLRSMVPQNSAKIINLGAVDYSTLTAAYLQKLPYSTTPIDGNDDSTNQLTANDVFAVLTNKGNYAKVQVITYGYDLTIRWVTYSIGSGYVVLGTGYNQPEDVRLSVDGVHAYVTERTGDLVKVALSSANRSAATVVATGMTAPQQLFLDEAHDAAYVVEYASAGSLLKVNLTSGVKTVVTALDNPIGLVLSSDLQYAYVSEQTTGPDLGRISQIQISGPTRTTLAKGLTNPFFLTWADAAQDSLLVPQRDPANSIVSVNVTSGATNVVASGVPFRPSSVALPYAGEMLICSDSVIEEVSFTPFAVDGPLLLGIGYIPAADVNASGFATTPAGSIYQVTDAPFGGTLPIIINYPAATGAAYYQVRVDGVPQTDSFTVYTGFPQVLITVPAQT
ncbi:MAG: YncE family protein, partial [Terriglobia bacterium]